MMTLDDLRRLDPKDMGSWPALVKLSVLLLGLIAIMTGFYFLDWQGQLDKITAEENKEKALRETFIEKKKRAINLEDYRKQQDDAQKALGTLLKQLPAKSEMEALLTDINQAGLGRGLQFELFKPGNENMLDSFAELPITVRVTGGYHDLGSFASDISKLSRIVVLNDLQLQAKDGALAMDAVAKTYRYLEQEELASQKKAAKAAKDKAGKK